MWPFPKQCPRKPCTILTMLPPLKKKKKVSLELLIGIILNTSSGAQERLTDLEAVPVMGLERKEMKAERLVRCFCRSPRTGNEVWGNGDRRGWIPEAS